MTICQMDSSDPIAPPLGWRLGVVVEREPGVSYAAAAQGIRRFWKRATNTPEMQAFVAALLDQLSNGQI